jgi:hypothetical protein
MLILKVLGRVLILIHEIEINLVLKCFSVQSNAAIPKPNDTIVEKMSSVVACAILSLRPAATPLGFPP